MPKTVCTSTWAFVLNSSFHSVKYIYISFKVYTTVKYMSLKLMFATNFDKFEFENQKRIYMDNGNLKKLWVFLNKGGLHAQKFRVNTCFKKQLPSVLFFFCL